MRFIIFVIDGPNNPASPDEMQKIDAFNEKLQNNGHWITAAGIQPGSKATLIDNRNNKVRSLFSKLYLILFDLINTFDEPSN